jgi:hypothetical protein
MKGRVLTEVKPSEYGNYINQFMEIASNDDFLTKKDIESMLKQHPEKSVGVLEAAERPVIGMVLNKCMDYQRFMELGVFGGVERELKKEKMDKIYVDWVIVNHLKGKYGIGIGSNDGELQIVETVHGGPSDSYFLHNKTNWIEPPKDFLKKTYEMLRPDDKKSWAILESIFS